MGKREKVIAILRKNGLEAYIPILEKNNLMDKELLSEMTDEDFEKLGIDNIADRKRLVKVFEGKGCLIALIIIVAFLVAGILFLHFTGLLGAFIDLVKWLGVGGALVAIFIIYCIFCN